MNHSFCVELAIDYGIEKAVIIENFFFWIKKNLANGVNVHNGKAYTYNTAEAFAELFPYFKPRRIAELLRQLEYEGLLLSGQFHGTDRKKSYTLTDKALQYFVSSNTQKSYLPLSKSRTMEDTENGLCTIADINNTDINNIYNSDTPKKTFKKPTVEEIRAYCTERKNKVDPERFFDFYESKGWKVGKSAMKDWRACVRTWEKQNFNNQEKKSFFDDNKLLF